MEINKKRFDISQLAISLDRYKALVLVCGILMSLFGMLFWYGHMISREPYHNGVGVFQCVKTHNEVNVIVNNRSFIISDYYDVEDLNTLCEKKVEIEWIPVYGKRKKIGDFLISVKDLNGKSLPYKNPYHYTPWEYDEALLDIFGLCFVIFLLCTIFMYYKKIQIQNEIKQIGS